jgi:hypothetical protein
MWNRVALLTAGMALGWSLVTWLSAAKEASARARFHLALATLAGVALVLWLGMQKAATAIVETFVLGIGASEPRSCRSCKSPPPPLLSRTWHQ